MKTKTTEEKQKKDIINCLKFYHGWTPAEYLNYWLDIPNNQTSKRKIRQLISDMPEVISSVKGYKLVRYSKQHEINAYIKTMTAHADRFRDRVLSVWRLTNKGKKQ